MVAAARAVPNVAAYLDGAEVRKTIFVPGRLVNFVADGDPRGAER